ncbi:MAG: hypothetical protein LBT46_02010 [Planctomycetaceae bacterium]|jgi:hypothetical protein|nr:hypothetical protein [Planctomycetaceae bacterium]
MPPPFVHPFGSALLLAFALTVMSAMQAYADSLSGNQEIWRINTRPVTFSSPNNENFAKLCFFRQTDNHWTTGSSETFFQTQAADIPLIVFVPGYTSTTADTTQTGLNLVRLFNADTNHRKYRIVFWDWYADRSICRIRPDIRSKIPIAKGSAGYLTLFLQSLQPESKVCLFGFSFGARIVCDGVQNLAESDAGQLHLRVVLSAAAADQHGLGSQSQYCNVVKYAEKVLVTYNPDDWALSFYPYMYEPGYRAEALGLLGVPMKSILPEYRSRIESVSVKTHIGIEHKTLKHAGSPVFRSRMDEYFFFSTAD